MTDAIDRQALDAARDVDERPLIVTYDDPAVAGFRTAARWLLANHGTERARIVFDEEIQRAIFGDNNE